MARRADGHTHGWQFILADLALILFLFALTGLPREAEEQPHRRAASASVPAAQIAPAQALFRPVKGGPTLRAWLADQPSDPRATLTIFAQHPAGGETQAWPAAEALAQEAAASGVAVRTIIACGTEADLYASLAYDTPPQAAP